jgi:hypothetical protein
MEKRGLIVSLAAGLSLALALLWVAGAGNSPAVAAPGGSGAAGPGQVIQAAARDYTGTRAEASYEIETRGVITQEQWVTETVDSAEVGLKGTSLALDSQGNVHISYQAGGELQYAVRAGSWHITTLTGLEGSYSALALRGSHPHIMFFNYYGHTSRLEYVYQDEAGDWFTGVVVSGGNNYSPRENVSVVMDDAGCLHFAFALFKCWTWGPTGDCWTWYPGDLMYSYQEGSGWKAPVAVGYTAGDSAMALDGNENVFVSVYNYVGWNDDHVEMLYHGYLGRGQTTPAIQVVDTPGVVGNFNAIAVDDSVYPPVLHISYYDATNGDLKYAKRTGASSWQIDVVDSVGDVGQYTSIALDAGGNPHISYYDVSNQDLKYAYRDASGWHTQTVDSAGDVGLFTSLALDADGRAHISYIDASQGDLRYAHLSGPKTWRIYLPLLGSGVILGRVERFIDTVCLI